MPEDKKPQAEAEQPAPPAPRRRIGPGLIAAVVVVLAAVVFVVVMTRGGKGPENLADKKSKPTHSAECLLIPTLEVAEIPISVPVDSTGIQRRGLSVGVVIYFAPAEGEHIKVEEMIKEFMPKAINLGPKFRSIIITELNTKEYNKLIGSDVRDRLLDGFKDKFNAELGNYGLNKLAVVDQVVWREFTWN